MIRLDLPSRRVRAPEFPQGFAWANTDRPFAIQSDLKGCVVVLDFWTYCCINCMHVLPDLEYLEQKYADQPVVIIGVHSAKFDNESDRANVQTACERYHIAHPVIVDENHRIWSEYGVRSWPTLVIIDPEGRIVGSLSGEGNRDILDNVVYSLLAEGREKKTLADAPPVIHRTGRVPSASGLAFPGKILADSTDGLVFISDSNHDRIIIADSGGKVKFIAGSGRKGQKDGAFREAEFNNPQGLAYDEENELLYVADTDNHLIRLLNLRSQTVETISGTGKQIYDRSGGGIGRQQGLNSPWDLSLVDNKLYIAMAGPHQLWTLDLKTLKAEAWVGSGYEDIQDGDGMQSALAQPSGLAHQNGWLYFADSEVSAIRKVNLQTREVETLIGHGLFVFGDRDGKLDQALLQHPLGVTVYKDDILIADTYNHKIKRIREQKGFIETVAGSEKTDPTNMNSRNLTLYEPGGLSVSRDILYIADTNHDRIIRYDLRNDTWSEFELTGMRSKEVEGLDLTAIPLQSVEMKPGRDVTLILKAEFPSHLHLNTEAPINYIFASADDTIPPIEGHMANGSLPVKITVPAEGIHSKTEYRVGLYMAYCKNDDRGLCVPFTLMWRLMFLDNESAGDTVTLSSPVREIM